MKKRIFMLLSLMTIGALSFGKENVVEVRAGISPATKFDVEPSKKAKTSFEVGAEYRYLVTENVELGGGIAYQKHGKLKRFSDVSNSLLKVDVSDTQLYDSIPLYATVKYNFRNDSEFTPYIKANLGYSMNVNGENNSHYETYSKVTGAMLDSGKLKDLKAKNGMYYAIGAGVEYRGFTADISYQINTAKIDGVRYDGQTDSGKADNRRVTLGIGYQMGF